MADTQKTMGPSACKRGLWGIVTLFSSVFLPHKPRLQALGLIVLHVSAIYEYDVLLFLVCIDFIEKNLVNLVATYSNIT